MQPDSSYMYVWYGMVWYGMVWYGMVWYGMVDVCDGYLAADASCCWSRFG